MINKYEALLKEYLDYNDPWTLKVLVEAGKKDTSQTQIMAALTSKLYDLIKDKADKVDFSAVSRSKGDFTKIEKYDQLNECINTIREIVIQYKQDTTPVDVISTAENNLVSRKTQFKKAFVVNSSIIKMTYNSVGMAIIQSISLLIATTINFITDPTSESFKMSLNTVAYSRMMENEMLNNLVLFNQSCKSGEMDNTIEYALNHNRYKHEMAMVKEQEIEVKNDSPMLSDDEIADGKNVIHDDDENKENKRLELHESIFTLIPDIIMFILKALIPLIRSIVYHLFSAKQKASDWFALQADMLEVNAYNLQYNDTISPEDRKKIYDRQMKEVQRFRRYANVLDLDYKASHRKATKMAENDDKNITTVQDIGYSEPEGGYDQYNDNNAEEINTHISSLF